MLGPLVLGGVVVREAELERLSALGVADSKTLSRTRRSALYAEIVKGFKTQALCFEPHELNDNLTQVELDGLAQLINATCPGRVYLDAPVGPKAIPNFVARLRSAIDPAIEIVAENRAESRYPVVAAASIVAKVVRDRAMEALHLRYGDIGWGYPAEAKTRAFLARCCTQGAFPPCVRTRWATVQRLKQRRLWE